MKRPLLLPLVPLYAAGLALRELRLERGWEPVRRLRYPVISIGNLSTGGSGKTPLTIALARLLALRGFQVDVLSRGYGRRSGSPLRVDPTGSPDKFGDEPLLIAREAGVPVYVAAERFDAGRIAEAESSARDPQRVHILDDGFQHRQLARDIDILLLNREDWHDHLLPAGNLRESLHAAMRATVIAIPSNDAGFESEIRARGWQGPIWRTRRRMEVPHIDGPVAAFCGIARPDQFFAGLEQAGLTLAFQKSFADHHRYTARDIQGITTNAKAAGAVSLITTDKDQVRLGGLATQSALPIKTARLDVELDAEPGIVSWLEERISAASPPQQDASQDKAVR